MAAASIHDLKIDRSGDEGSSSRALWMTVALLLVALLLGLAYWLKDSHSTLVVKTAVALAGDQAKTGTTVLNASGYVTARRSATVSSKVTGKIIEILVEEGDTVAEGQVVAHLDPVNVQGVLELVEAQLVASEAATAETEELLSEAALDLNRVSRLAESMIASQADFDQAKARQASLRARLRRLVAEVAVAARQVAVRRQELEDLAIRAPFDGVVISKDAQPGEVISPASAGSGFTRTGICTVVDMQSLEIEVDVNESYINRVSAGQSVTAVLDAYTDWKIKGAVIAIVPAADRQKATVKVRIGLADLDARILPEMGVKVSFQNGAEPDSKVATKPSVTIPSQSLIEASGQSYVWIVSGGKVERRAIRVGGSQGQRSVVEAGVRAGEVLVVSPPEELTNGLEVDVDAL